MKKCKCGANIVFVTTKNGKFFPCNEGLKVRITSSMKGAAN